MKKALSATVAILLTLAAFLFLTSVSLDNSGKQSAEWYTRSVDHVVSAGILSAADVQAFSPSENISRAMFVTMLGRYAEIDTATLPAFGKTIKTKVNLRSQPNTKSEVLALIADVGTPVEVLSLTDGWYNIRYNGKPGYVRADLMSASDTRFSDIGFGTEYGGYVRWAHNSGILDGLVDDASQARFKPDSDITREQICMLLYNYSIAAGISFYYDYDMAEFADDSDIGDNARVAVYAMQQAGIVGGYSDGSFIPGGNATQAEAAAILSRFITVAEEDGSLPVQASTVYSGYQLLGNVVQESSAVPDSYFNDACFIGHSMVVGMKSYFSLPRADFFAVNGISTGGVLRHEGFQLTTYRTDPATGEKVYNTGTIRDALRTRTYGKVYIMLGTNELGPEARHSDSFYNNLCSLIDLVRAKQPTANIYLISILPISKSRSESSANFNRENVLEFNKRMMQVSREKSVYYIDVFSEFADSDGYLPSSACVNDGVHILSREYSRLKTYLKTHTA